MGRLVRAGVAVAAVLGVWLSAPTASGGAAVLAEAKLHSSVHPSPASAVAAALQTSTARPFAAHAALTQLADDGASPRAAAATQLHSSKKEHARRHQQHNHRGDDKQAKEEVSQDKQKGALHQKNTHARGARGSKAKGKTSQHLVDKAGAGAGEVVYVHQTTSSNDDRLARLQPLPVQQRAGGAPADVSVLTIDPATVYQTLIGFGGAITEASVTVLSKLPSAATQQVIDAYYGAEGNRYSVGRLHINSCDFSVNSWTFDNTTDDFALKNFDHQLTHDQQYLIPFVQHALKESYHPLRLFASPWSPPAWMKGNNNQSGSSEPGLKKDPRYHDAWARYLSTWFTDMGKFGVPFWGMTVQNEPEYAAPWEACVYSAEQERDFIRDYLGPTMRATHPDLNIMIYDHNKDHVVEWADTIFSDKDAAQYLWGTGLHWYSGDEFDHVNTTYTHWPNKGLLATEATNMLTGPAGTGSFPNAEKYAHDILGDLNAFVQGWTDWNIVLNEQGGPNHLNNWCDAPIIADTRNGTLAFQPMYFYLGHFSRFLPPGSQRIAHSMDNWQHTDGLEYATFLVQREDKAASALREGQRLRDPATAPAAFNKQGPSAAHPSAAGADVVVVVMNPKDQAFDFQIALANDKYATVHLPPHAIQTLQFDAQLLH